MCDGGALAAFEQAQRIFGDKDPIVLKSTVMFTAKAHAERHSRSFKRLRRSQVRMVLSGTLWRDASSS